MAKAANLAAFNVKKPQPLKLAGEKQAGRFITKGFRITPGAAHQFEMLRAELGMEHPKDMGPKLIAEGLNLLFKKYGKPQIA